MTRTVREHLAMAAAVVALVALSVLTLIGTW